MPAKKQATKTPQKKNNQESARQNQRHQEIPGSCRDLCRRPLHRRHRCFGRPINDLVTKLKHENITADAQAVGHSRAAGAS